MQTQKYAVIQYGGRQYRVFEGTIFEIEQQSKLDMDVLLYRDDKNLLIGTPTLDTVVVKATKIEDKKDKKVNVSRYKSKSKYRRSRGFRQPISVIKIDSISLKSETKSKTTQKPTEVKEKATVAPTKNTKTVEKSEKAVKITKAKTKTTKSTKSKKDTK